MTTTKTNILTKLMMMRPDSSLIDRIHACVSRRRNKFLDIVNYLAPCFSYDKYLKAYDCELQKGHFPYEYMDGIRKLEDRALLPKKRSTVDSRTKIYPSMTTLALRQCGVNIV